MKERCAQTCAGTWLVLAFPPHNLGGRSERVEPGQHARITSPARWLLYLRGWVEPLESLRYVAAWNTAFLPSKDLGQKTLEGEELIQRMNFTVR